MPDDGPLMRIGELAARTECPSARSGTTTRPGSSSPPAGPRAASASRAEDLSRLLLIRRMKPLGFSLEDMPELLRVIDARRDAQAGAQEHQTGLAPHCA
jgi:MerR family copper efflux transcriptional regulator